MKLAGLILIALAVNAQVVITAPNLGVKPGAVTFQIVLSGTGVSAVQWNTASTQAFSPILSTTPLPNSKTLECSAQADGSTKCVISGTNADLIPAGVVAAFAMNIPSSLVGTKIPIALSNAVASDPTGHGVGASTVSGTIDVQDSGCLPFTLTYKYAGSLAVYRNGVLQASDAYSVADDATGKPVVTPLAWTSTDSGQALYTRAAPPRTLGTINGIKYTYQTYVQQREEWSCTTGLGGPK